MATTPASMFPPLWANLDAFVDYYDNVTLTLGGVVANATAMGPMYTGLTTVRASGRRPRACASCSGVVGMGRWMAPSQGWGWA